LQAGEDRLPRRVTPSSGTVRLSATKRSS